MKRSIQELIDLVVANQESQWEDFLDPPLDYSVGGLRKEFRERLYGTNQERLDGSGDSNGICFPHE